MCAVADGVATVTLNRPDRMNAWTHAMEVAYFDLVDSLDDDPDVRAVVLTGAGRGFCPGLDAGDLAARTQGVAGQEGVDRPMTHARTLRKPLIAAINGGCAGIGLVQALVADLRFAAAGVKIATAFTRRGLVAEFGASWMLPRLVGTGNAMDLLLSGRAVTAEEALAMGLVNRVYPADELVPGGPGLRARPRRQLLTPRDAGRSRPRSRPTGPAASTSRRTRPSAWSRNRPGAPTSARASPPSPRSARRPSRRCRLVDGPRRHSDPGRAPRGDPRLVGRAPDGRVRAPSGVGGPTDDSWWELRLAWETRARRRRLARHHVAGRVRRARRHAGGGARLPRGALPRPCAVLGRRARPRPLRSHVAARRSDRAEGALPAAHHALRGHVGAGLQRARGGFRPRRCAHRVPCATATSGC